MKGIGLYQVKEKLQKIKKEISTLEGLITKMQVQTGERDPADSTRELVATYCEEFKARWKVNPTMGGKQIGVFQRLLKDHGLERSKVLIKAYIQMSDPFFLKKRHDVVTLSMSITSVGHFADTGKLLTNGDARVMERSQKYGDLFTQIDEGKL